MDGETAAFDRDTNISHVKAARNLLPSKYSHAALNQNITRFNDHAFTNSKTTVGPHTATFDCQAISRDIDAMLKDSTTARTSLAVLQNFEDYSSRTIAETERADHGCNECPLVASGMLNVRVPRYFDTIYQFHRVGIVGF